MDVVSKIAWNVLLFWLETAFVIFQLKSKKCILLYFGRRAIVFVVTFVNRLKLRHWVHERLVVGSKFTIYSNVFQVIWWTLYANNLLSKRLKWVNSTIFLLRPTVCGRSLFERWRNILVRVFVDHWQILTIFLFSACHSKYLFTCSL